MTITNIIKHYSYGIDPSHQPSSFFPIPTFASCTGPHITLNGGDDRAENEKSLTALTVRLLVGAEGVEPPTLCL